MRPLRFGNSFIHFTNLQIDQVAKKFSGKLKLIKKMERLPVEVLEEIYFKVIIPCVTYCIAVWGTCPTASFNRLEVLNAKAAKMIYKLSSETHDLEALHISNWKPLSYIYKRRIAAIMYQVRNKTLPRQLVELFPLEDNSTNHHNLRHKKDFVQIRANNECGRNSLRYRWPLMWNHIPSDVRNARTLLTFKALRKGL